LPVRRASGLLALHAGALEELDLVARADDVFVVDPTAVYTVVMRLPARSSSRSFTP
jgi:hypothetical protein